MKFQAVWIAVAACAALIGCKSSTDVTPDQRTAFERYLDGLQVEYTQQGGVYRVVANSDREGYESAPEIEAGDSAYLYFAGYTFASSTRKLYYTNMESVAGSVEGLDTEYWSYDPWRIRMGATPMIKGLGNGLPGCRQGDSVALFITSDLAYDDKQVGMVGPNTAVMMIVNVEKVIK